MKSVAKLLLAVALGVTTLTACPGGGGGGSDGGATINSFKAKIANTTRDSAETLTLPPVGGTVQFDWSVTGADSVEIDNAVLAPSPVLTGNAQKTVSTTTTFTLKAKKAGKADATKTVSVNVQTGITVTGKVLKFNGEGAFGVRVQVGDADGTFNQQIQSTSDGSFTFQKVPTPYVVSAVPTTAIESPVSYKGVTTPNPVIVLQPRTGITTACANSQEGYIRFRLPAGSKVDDTAGTTALGYVYFIANGTRATALHEDSLKSNAVQVLKPGQRTGYIRVRFSQNSCASQVEGSLVYMERNATGYTQSGIRPNVIARSGSTTPASGDQAYEIPTGNNGSKAISGEIRLPGAFTSGFAFLVVEIGGGSVIVSDPRDIKAISLTTEGRRFAFQLPQDLGSSVKYRIGVYATGPKHDSWFFSDNIRPLPNEGKTGVIIETPNEVSAQQPSGVNSFPPASAQKISFDFDWPESTGANLYFIQWAKALPLATNCTNNDYFWTAVSADPTNVEQLTNFSLPVLPEPARLEAGTDAKPCIYNWTADNAVTVRAFAGGDAPETAVTSDKMLDGRLVLKRHYIRSDSAFTGALNFLLVVPVIVTQTASPTEAQLLFRDENIWKFKNEPATFLDMIGGNALAEASVPAVLDISPTNSTGADVAGPFPEGPYTIPNATNEQLNQSYSSEFVGPFNNPSEIKSGVISRVIQEFRIKLGN